MARRFGIYLWRLIAFLAAFATSVIIAALFMLFLGYLGFAQEPELQKLYALGAVVTLPVVALYIALYSFPVAVFAKAVWERWGVPGRLFFI